MFDANVVLDVVSLIIIVAMLITQIYSNRKDGRTISGNIFLSLMIGLIIILSFDIVGWELSGHMFPGAFQLSYIVNTMYWICQIVYCWLWLSFVIFYSRRAKISFKKATLYTFTCMILEVGIIIANLWTGWVFFITEENNAYMRGPFYAHNLLPFFIYIFSAIVMTIVEAILTKDKLHKRKCALLAVYASVPIIGVLIQSFSYGMSLIWPFITLGLALVFISEQQDKITQTQILEAREREKRIQLENELVDTNVKIMLSQIQPHFIYNVLTTIAQLCDLDPQVAKQATIDFSKYLRANIDSLRAVSTIPFQTELEHIQKYIALEKLRFEDDLNVVYDIRTTSFMIPPLSIQPLIENAVKYGVGQKEDGGTIYIITREEEKCYRITIKDNGVGFDVNGPIRKDGRTHIGIEGTKNRLKTMCNGTLKIESKKGTGTIVTVDIPKGE